MAILYCGYCGDKRAKILLEIIFQLELCIYIVYETRRGIVVSGRSVQQLDGDDVATCKFTRREKSVFVGVLSFDDDVLCEPFEIQDCGHDFEGDCNAICWVYSS